VNVASSDGTEVRLNEARIDIKKGHVVSDEPVEVLMPMGRIDAQRLEIGDSGALIQFRGGVVMNVRQAEDTRSQASRTEAAQ
jgi:lipopolysaccharide export system protein LptC